MANPRDRMYRQTASQFRQIASEGDRGGRTVAKGAAVGKPFACLLLPDGPRQSEISEGDGEEVYYTMECDVRDLRVGDLIESDVLPPGVRMTVDRWVTTPNTGFKVTAFMTAWLSGTIGPRTSPTAA